MLWRSEWRSYYGFMIPNGAVCYEISWVLAKSNNHAFSTRLSTYIVQRVGPWIAVNRKEQTMCLFRLSCISRIRISLGVRLAIWGVNLGTGCDHGNDYPPGKSKILPTRSDSPRYKYSLQNAVIWKPSNVQNTPPGVICLLKFRYFPTTNWADQRLYSIKLQSLKTGLLQNTPGWWWANINMNQPEQIKVKITNNSSNHHDYVRLTHA